jgi:uncharacterized protein YfbU (UPF0304 family)
MILNKGEEENILSCSFIKNKYFNKNLYIFVKLLRNIKIKNNININLLLEKLNTLITLINKDHSKLEERLNIFFEEVKEFLKILEKSIDPIKIKKKIKNFQILFKGFNGVRHIDYIAYKPK